MRSKKPLFFLGILLVGFVIFSTQIARGSISFGIKNPGLLPTSPLYFLKEWRRDFVRMFVTDSLSQARLESRIVDEKAAELKKVLELKSLDKDIIRESLENYSNSIKRLTSKLKEIELSSEEKRLSEFFEELFEKAVEHEKFLNSVSKKYVNDGSIQNLVVRTQDEINSIVPEYVRNQFERAENEFATSSEATSTAQ